jgi:hypothetical protein
MSALPPFRPRSEPLPTKPGITGRRAASRVRLLVPAQVMLLTGLTKCVLDDLSQHGARVTLSVPAPRQGSGAVLQIRNIEAFGTVVWVSGQRFGLQFDEPVPLPNVIAIRHYADEYAEHEAQASLRNARVFVQGRPGIRKMS